jgi:uncharacterized damage-inducible protein DinB
VSTDDDWLKAMQASQRPAATSSTFKPASAPALAAYAHRLRKANPALSRAAAKQIAEQHENERRRAHQRNS